MTVAKPPISKAFLVPLSVIIHIAESTIRALIMSESYIVLVIAFVDIVVTTKSTLFPRHNIQYIV